MDRYHCLGSGRDFAPEIRNIDGVIVSLYVDKYRPGASGNDGVGCGHKGKGRQKHLIPRAYAGGKERSMKRGRAGINSNNMPSLKKIAQQRFKILNAPATFKRCIRKRAFFKHAQYLAYFLVVNQRLVYGNHAGPYRLETTLMVVALNLFQSQTFGWVWRRDKGVNKISYWGM